jgi:hypothetical protein
MIEGDGLLDTLVERLRDESGCHTIILYGSRARGDATATSDYDVIGFHDTDGPVFRQAGLWRGGLMDIFVYPTGRLKKPSSEFLHVRGGRVLLERGDLGRRFLRALEAVYAKGPPPLAADELAALRVWAWKMLDRASVADVEGNYRRTWLLTMLLEHYFTYRGRWYPGSKQAFKDLGASDPTTLALFEAALIPGALAADLIALVEHVSGPRDTAYALRATTAS